MDPRVNPYSPGAGSPPPELAGREQVIESVSIALDRMRNGLVARSVVLFGLRGVGKTVLLNRLQILFRQSLALQVVNEKLQKPACRKDLPFRQQIN